MTFTELGSGNSRGLACAFMETPDTKRLSKSSVGQLRRGSTHYSATLSCRERNLTECAAQIRGSASLASPSRQAHHFERLFGGLSTMAGMVEDSVRRRWSTREVEPRRALAYWIDTIC